MSQNKLKWVSHLQKEQTFLRKSIAALSSMIIKRRATPGRVDEDALLANELRRLALLSPHLLSDVGLTATYVSEGPLDFSGNHQNRAVEVEVRNGRCNVCVAHPQIQH